MRLTRWCLMAVLGASLLGAGCNIAGTSTQEDLGRGIVRGTLGAQPGSDVRFPISANAFSLKGQVMAVEGGAYVLQEVSGIERRVAHDENTRIDRPAHVGDRIEVFMDDKGRAVIIRNIDHDEGSQ
ncbi:MAG: hypothetical protein ABIQ24_11395 [Nitrospiraceae bacterium]